MRDNLCRRFNFTAIRYGVILSHTAEPSLRIFMHTSTDPTSWVTQYGDALYRYALMRVREPALAEDLVQETLLAALKASKRFAGQSSEKTWLIGILKHKMVDHFRKHKYETQIENIDLARDTQEDKFDHRGHWNVALKEWANPDSDLEKKEFWQVFQRCIQNLPDHLADLFVLREINGLPSKEVCKVLDISTTNNMWVMLSRSRMRLRQCLEANWFGNETTGSEK